MAPLPEIDVPWMLDLLLRLLRTPSPAGRTDAVMQLLGDELADLPVELSLTRRGSLLARLPGREARARRAVVVHADTIGCMVRDLKANGRLAVVPVGTHSSRFAEGCRVTILTDDPDRTYTGTILPLMASGHAFGDEVDTQPTGLGARRGAGRRGVLATPPTWPPSASRSATSSRSTRCRS